MKKSSGSKPNNPQRTAKERGRYALRWTVDMILIVLGGVVYSLGLICFSVPNGIVAGGVSGISTIINELTGVSVGLLYGLINVPLVIVGLIFLGKKMMLKTLVSVVTITVFTDYAPLYIDIPVYDGGDKILAAIFGGIMLGAGLGVVYLREGTSGGTDIINKLINKIFPHFRLGSIMLATDAVIVAAAMIVYKTLESGLYAIIALFICSKVMDMILYGSYEGKMLLIFSDKYAEIANYIMTTLDRGVTLLDGTGAYSSREKHVICCAVHKSEYSKIKRRVKETDPSAFIIITNAGEVLGEGFHDNA